MKPIAIGHLTMISKTLSQCFVLDSFNFWDDLSNIIKMIWFYWKKLKKLSDSPLLILWCRIILVYLMKAFITNNFLVYLTLPTHPLIHLHIYQSYIWAGLFHRTVTWRHRRRIKTEEKAKVVACCLGDVLYLNAAQTI